MKIEIADYWKRDRYLLQKLFWTVIFKLVTQLTFVHALTVKGRVNDSEGQTLPEVSILDQGTSKGTLTDIDGNSAN